MSCPEPTVGVVITTRNDEASIKDCVSALFNVDYPPDKLEVVIVDRGSRDNTLALARGWPVHLLRSADKSVTRARNRGIEATKAAVVVFTDPDCVATTQWLRALVAPFRREDVGAVAGDILPYPGDRYAEKFAARARSHSPVRSTRHPFAPYAMTPNAAFRREVFERIGFFDTRFPGGGWEDADLCWRMHADGFFKLSFVADAIVFHRYRTSPRTFFVQHLRYGRGCALIQEKYRSELTGACKLTLYDYHVIRRLVRMVRVAAARGDREQRREASFALMRETGQWLGYGIGLLRARVFTP